MLKKYVISLRPRRECSETPNDLKEAIAGLASVRVVEGLGRRAVTVEMSEQTAKNVAKRMHFATVSSYAELDLLEHGAGSGGSRS